MVFATFKKKLLFNKGINAERSCCFKGRYAEKWDRILATVTAVLTFTLLLTYVIFTAVNERQTSSQPNQTESAECKDSTLLRDLEDAKCALELSCSVVCASLTASDDIAALVNQITSNTSCIQIAVLTIKASKFENKQIQQGWLQLLTLPVISLVISSTDLTEIGARAFAGHPFNGLASLQIEDSPLSSLEKASFLESDIDSFTLAYSSEHRISVEAEALMGMNSSLVILNMKRCLTDDAITNLTGTNGAYLKKLVTLDLSYNYITKVSNLSFAKAPNVVQIYLQGNDISEVQVNAFAGISSIKTLSVSNNDLSTMPEGVLDYLKPNISTDLSNNPWHCNCSLQWLKDWYLASSNYNRTKTLVCSNKNDQKFEEVDFGCTENNTSTKTTGTPSTVPSDGTSYSYMQLLCTDAGTTTFPEYFEDGTYAICVRTNMMELEIVEIDVETASYEIKVKAAVDRYQLIWFNTKNKDDYVCVSNVDDRFVMENLEREATYTICALYEQETTTSPFDCVGFAVPEEWEARTWIPRGMMKKVIGGICGVLVLEAILIGLIVFYCIRQHPRFISGNKRVVVVSTKTTDAVIMPKSYPGKATKQSFPTKPTVPIAVTPSYLTLKYAKLADKRKRMLRSMSESSVFSGSSYINKEELYHRRKRETTLYEVNDEEHVYETPALPPNHPVAKRQSCR